MTVAHYLPCTTFGGQFAEAMEREKIGISALRVRRREVIYGCADRGKSLYLVKSGQVKATLTSRDGKECLLGIYASNEFFGESCLLETSYRETATAMTDTELWRVSTAWMKSALCDPRLRDGFIAHLANRIFSQQMLITDLVTADSEYRLAAVLLYLGRKLGQRDGNILRIQARITQEELSAMVGTTRSRVGFFLKRFREAGIIRRNRQCFLALDEDRLKQYIEAERD